MKFAIKHEIKGRLRVHMAQQRMTYDEVIVEDNGESADNGAEE